MHVLHQPRYMEKIVGDLYEASEKTPLFTPGETTCSRMSASSSFSDDMAGFLFTDHTRVLVSKTESLAGVSVIGTEFHLDPERE